MIITQQGKDSATARALIPEAVRWGLQEQLLAGIGDLLALLNWRDSGRGTKARRDDRPPPIERPGSGPKKISHRGEAMPADEFARRMKARQARMAANPQNVT